MNKLWYLRRLDLFDGLSEPELHELAALMQDRRCRTGDDVVERPTGDRIYLVKRGRVRVMSGDVAVAVLGPGRFFGVSSFFGAASTAQRVIAIDEVVVCDAPAGRFLQAMTAHPRLAGRMAIVLARQLFEAEQAVERGAGDIEARLADLVIHIAARGPAGPSVHGVGQAELGAMIGASRESVSRVLSRWERDGLVRVRHRGLEIFDEDRLRAVATA